MIKKVLDFKGYTHALTSVAIYLFVAKYLDVTISIITITPFIVFGSLLPDIDTPYSIIGRIVAPIQIVMKHRGITHTLVGLCLFAIPVLLFGNKLNLIGFIYGYVSHLFLDLLTPVGIQIAYPFNKNRYSFNLCKTGGFVELALFCLSLQYIFLSF